MTWNEFKKHVDDKLEKAGISGDEGTWYIDIHAPTKNEVGSPKVTLDDIRITVVSYL